LNRIVESKLGFSDNALEVLKKRYLARDKDGQPIETVEQMFERVANAVASAEKEFGGDETAVAEKFYTLMVQRKFMPNSPTLMNAGRELGQLSACFVLPVADAMDSIFDAVKHTALIHKSGGGTGFSFSRLRPRNDAVNSTRGVSSGPVSFMTVFDAATETVKQGGTRRGANIGILRVDHPDIMDFIICKQENDRLNNFNISVALTDTFMQAVADGTDYALINPRTGEEFRRLDAQSVFRAIVEGAHRNGEPGIIFIDRINRDNPTPQIGEVESTNPCGEQPLLPYESCNLGSLNLERFEENGEIDYESLGDTIDTAVRFLDNVIQVNRYPLPEIKEMTRANRKIGLGVMGYADLLIRLGVPYDSEKAVNLGRELMDFIDRRAVEASRKLATERGAFPNFAGSFLEVRGLPEQRNATVTTIAPTGTISIIAGCSSGIEPVFALCYERNVLDGARLKEVHPLFEKLAREQEFYNEELMKDLAKHGSVAGIEEVPDEIKKVFVTAHDIMPQWHVRMQAAFQESTDNAVSKTVNFASTASIEDVRQVFILAHQLGCKGVTVYRDRSRENQVLQVSQDKPKKDERHKKVPRARSEVALGQTRRMNTGCGKLYVTINEDDKGPMEVFTSMGKAGGCAASQLEAISRLISLSLRAGVNPQSIIRQLHSVRCPAPAWDRGTQILSCSDAIAKAMQQYMLIGNGEDEQETRAAIAPVDSGLPGPGVASCPDCGGSLEYEGGCTVCRLCGYSRC
jgi:ribonucleoside-diphosphate reductase alpha chain